MVGLDPGLSPWGDALSEQNFLTYQICVIAALHRCDEEQMRSRIQSAWPIMSTGGIFFPFPSPSERSDHEAGDGVEVGAKPSPKPCGQAGIFIFHQPWPGGFLGREGGVGC